MSLLTSPKLLRAENRLILLFDRTFQKAANVGTLNYSRELPANVKRWFGSAVFSKQLDQLITEIIKQSILYADSQMKILTAAETGQATILTQEAVRMAKELSSEVSESIVRMLDEDAIYYEHPNKLARRIKDLWGGERYRAVRFARTFTADVATASTVARYRQYGVRYMEFDAKLDDRTTDQCRCLNGTIFDLEQDSVDRYRPPLHMHCRSGLKPVSSPEKIDENMIFENRDFSSALEDPAKVDKAFQNIGKFNEKYRVSKYVIDQDIATRMMFEKGFSVGISGPDLSGLVDTVKESPIRISNNMISRLPKTHYEIMTELKNEGMIEFDSQVRFLQSVLRNRQWHNVKLSDEDVQIFKKVYLDYLTESKKYKDYAAGLSKLSDDDLLKEYQTLRNGKLKTAVFDWYSENDMSKLDSMVTEALGYSTDSTRSGLLYSLSQEEREQVTKSYYATQEYLKRKYPSGKITVYRGVTSDTYKELAANGLDSAVNVRTYNLSCWTEDVNVARGFTVSKDGGVVLKADVPIEKVYMHYDISNPIHDFEKEITTLGDEMSATVYDIRDANSTYTRKEKIEMELERERLRNLPKEPKKEDELDFDAMFGF